MALIRHVLQVGRSALSRAAKAGHTETVELLLNRKAEIDAVDQARIPHPHAKIARRRGAGAAKEPTSHFRCLVLYPIVSSVSFVSPS